MQAAVTLTNPFLAPDGGWFSRLLHRQFPLTPLSLIGLTGSWTIVVFALSALTIIVLIALALPLSPPRPRTANAAAAIALLGWVALAYGGPRLLQQLNPTTGALAAFALLAVITTTSYLAHRAAPPLAATHR
jgi:hypothetical protein